MLTYIKAICFMFGSLLGFEKPALWGGIVLLAFALMLIVTIIIPTVKFIKKRKKP